MKLLILCLLLLLIPFQAVATPPPTPTTSTTASQYNPVILASQVQLAPLPIYKERKEPPSYTPLKAPVTISPEILTQYLESKNSPLAPYSAQILESPYWSVIIGICSVEQYGCSRAPDWNYWGLMKAGGGLQRFSSAEEGISAISTYLEKQVSQGRDMLESFRGFYCVNRAYPGNVCPGWETTVKNVKTLLESYAASNNNPNTNNN